MGDLLEDGPWTSRKSGVLRVEDVNGGGGALSRSTQDDPSDALKGTSV